MTKLSTIEYNRKRILHKAKQFGDTINCKCGEKSWRVVPLYEYGDFFMPSTIVLKCRKCEKSVTFAKTDIESAKAFGEELVKQGFIQAPKGTADKLIKS